MSRTISDSLESKKLDRIYLFGYGSLLWKVEFNYTRKFFGYVKGYVRQFWLLSDDHRGTPEK
jgi:cation transport protein ChaC